MPGGERIGGRTFMRLVSGSLMLLCFLTPALAQEKTGEPTDEKARKTYENALKSLHEHKTEWALDDFKKADKQDGGHCLACQKQMIKLGKELGDWKTAELGAEEIIAEAQTQGQKDAAIARYQLALVLLGEGLQKHKEEIFVRAHEELGKALAAYPAFPDALYIDGRVLAQLKRDDESKASFEQFVKLRTTDDPDHQRALRYIARPELARARMAPPFSVTTIDGQKISMDALQGRVVLLDFWATWCVPCREALPHIQKVAKKFQGEPLVILSVSLDSEEQKWKDFIVKNEMTWPQYRDGSFSGPIARMFGVNAIPHTFTIDADGVLQDEHIGDASIEGKLKKLIAHARELQSTDSSAK
jgi:thiol-disulfide isomerase/thioredoxin